MDLVRKYALAFGDITVNQSETEASAWASPVTYMMNAEVVRDHRIYVSTIDNNQGIDPLGETQQSVATTRWLFRGYTNAWSFLDGVLSNATTATTSLVITVDNIGTIDTIVLFGVFGHDARVEGFNSADVKIYDYSQNLRGREVSDWYQMLFEQFSEFSDKVTRTDIPSPVVKITVTVTGDNIILGELFLGDAIDIGKALLNGTEGQAVTHSRFEFNAYSDLNLVKRPTRNEMKYTVHATRQRFNAIKPLMDRMAGDLCVAIGSASKPSTVHFGVLDVMSWPEGLPDDVIFNFSVRGVS